MTLEEKQFIKELIEALQRKCKTDALYTSCSRGLKIINKEIELDLERCIHSGKEWMGSGLCPFCKAGLV